MICKFCGNEIANGANFCFECGAKVEKTENFGTPAYSAAPVQTYQAAYAQENKSSGKNSAEDTFAVVSLVLSIVGFFAAPFILSVLSIVFGVFGLKSTAKKNCATAGIIISALRLVLEVVIVLLIVLAFGAMISYLDEIPYMMYG